MNNNLSDEKIVKGCISKDRVFQQILFDKYRKMMFSIAYRITSDTDLANDALQDSFIEIFKCLKNFQYKSSLDKWIKTIVIRFSIKLLNKEKKYLEKEDLDNVIIEEQPIDFTAEELDKAILSLPSRNRAVFVLIEIEGYKHKEVADMLNVSVGTSKSQLNYAKNLLRKKLWGLCN